MALTVSTFADVGAATGYDPQQILSAEGIDPATAESAAAGALNLAQGGSAGFSAVAPLIGLGLAATGVGAPVAALVTGFLEGAQALAGLLGGGSVQADWFVGATGFKGPKPYGPQDPTWKTWETFVAQSGGPGSWLVTGAFPWYPTIARDAAQLKSDPASQFQRAYFAAWKRNAELRINGYKGASPYALLASMAAAWNAQHAPGSGFDITTNGAGTWSQVSSTQGRDAETGEYIAAGATRAATGWYLGALLDGQVDGQRYPPVHLNTGAAAAAGVKLASLTGVKFGGPAALSQAVSASAKGGASSSGTGASLAMVACAGLVFFIFMRR